MPDHWRDWLAWILILFVIAFSVIRTQQNNSEVEDVLERLEYNYYQDQIDRCLSGQQLRSATRDNTRGVYQLALSLAERPIDAPPPTPEEVERYENFLDRLREYKEDTLAKVPPIAEQCREIIKEWEAENE